MKGMSLEAARACLLPRWDKHDFDFDFGELTAAGGGGGGDPDGSGSSALAAVQEAPPSAAAAPRRLDIRTRTLEVQMELMALASRRELLREGKALTTWHERAGELPVEVLRLIDVSVRKVRCPPACPPPPVLPA